MIRIAFVAHQANLSGAAKSLWQILKHLDKTKFEIIVISNKSGPGLARYLEFAPVYYFHVKEKRSLRRFRKRLRACEERWYRRLLKSFNPHCIYFNTNGSPHFMEWSQDISAVKICHLHGHNEGLTYTSLLDGGIRTPVDQKRIDIMLATNDYFIACANACQCVLLNELDVEADRIHVVHESIDSHEIMNHKFNLSRDELGWQKEEIVVGCAANFQYRKGPDIFVEAARILKQRNEIQKFKFVWIGGDRLTRKLCYSSPYALKMKRRISEYELNGRVELLGHVSKVYDYFNLIDIFALPSRDECLPLSLLEAMVLKKKVVCTSVSGIPEAIRNDGGILVEPESPEAFANGVIEAAEKSSKNMERVRIAYDRVINEFDITQQVAKIEHIITQAINAE